MLKKIFTLFLLICGLTYSQSLSEPVNSNDVYEFLERLNLKGIITFHTEVKPLSRIHIAGKLVELKEKRNQLSVLESEQLDFFLKEYFDETARLTDNFDGIESGFFKMSDKQRFRFYNYSSATFGINVDPILGIDYANHYGSEYKHRWNGALFSGYLGDGWGFSMDFRDNEESGTNIDSIKNFTRDKGINRMITKKNSFEFSEVNALLSYSWSFGSLSAGKENINWGSGKGGKLIFSDKAPSFPMIRLNIQPLEWLRFTYIHGWLHSDLIDSSTYRTSLVEDRDSYSQIPKFIAAHILSADVTNDITVSIGESMIYGDEIEPLYLIPIMFFRLADHYLAKQGSNTGDNAQLFADVQYKIPAVRTKFYSTAFVDELSITNLLKGKNLSAVAFTLGGTIADPVIRNSSLTLEYTRLNPFVYMNSNPLHLYSNYGYQLGHWIGSNADQFYVEYVQQIFSCLNSKIKIHHVRKGQTELPEEQYQLPYPEFLYGQRLSQTQIDVSVKYITKYSITAEAYFTYNNTKDDEQGRLLEFIKGSKNSFGLRLFYGL